MGERSSTGSRQSAKCSPKWQPSFLRLIPLPGRVRLAANAFGRASERSAGRRRRTPHRAGLAGERRAAGRHSDRGDHFARLHNRLNVRCLVGQPVKVDQRDRALPAAPRASTAASRAKSATARSDARAAMQLSLVPSTACFSPPIAAQPEPGARLLQAA
jgi:hypothetical protein